MADQNERPTPPDADASLPAKPGTAEVVDAEVVDSVGADVVAADSASSARRQQPAADEEFRQYQQFLEFQKFREWQQTQGGDVAVPPTGAPPAAKPKTPWWKRALRLLRYKIVRRLIYLLLALLLIPYAIDYYFSGGSGSGDGGTGTGGGVPVDSVPVKSTNPQQAVRGVYNWLRGPDPERACDLFDPAGESGFAAAYQAPDCPTAARQVHDRISDPGAYANPKFDHNAVTIVGPEAQVLGCRMQVGGGPLLGSFKLTQQPDGGWTISAYALQAASCG
ncbi:hypothetical protein BJ970_002248 [Saccharopolyspora phatthalungensis]|uniref:Uncharacterized protein n=1 Tax=Saccharopolyspora phatthalungensis TaxID=664693 RepID=A0A840Q2M5_9PSEU|nr:hypothetical protein [Saccharopolyspora phatthalungensis]MBB5154714.1 hypothetical protein [Saccharopolyspora phatthalungensis]